MPHEESPYPADWIRIAEKDLGRVDGLLEKHDPELAGFCLQQAAEKFLKAFLLFHGRRLRRIHNLDALLDDAITYDASLEDFRSVCQKISGFYFNGEVSICCRDGRNGGGCSHLFGTDYGTCGEASSESW